MIAYATRCDCDTKFALYSPGFPVCIFKLLTSIFSISLSLYECVTLLFPQSSRIPWRTHTLTAHNARGYMTTRDPARGSAGVRVSERYRFDARGPTTHGAAHAAVPSRLLCIYSNYVTSRIHCSPHHCTAEAAESRRVQPSMPESAATARMARRPSSPPRPVTCRFVFSSRQSLARDRPNANVRRAPYALIFASQSPNTSSSRYSRDVAAYDNCER